MAGVRKLIFLDVDGVLNHDGTRHRVNLDGSTAQSARGGLIGMSSECVLRLQRLVEATGASLVLSSSWRIVPGMAATMRCLRSQGWRGQERIFIGETPRFWGDHGRGREIATWLEANPHDGETRVVILDDHHDMEPLLDRLVSTSHEDGGLGERHLEEAARMLG